MMALVKTFLLGSFVLFPVAEAAPSVKESAWELIGNKEGLELFRRETEGSDVLMMKGSGTIEAPLWKLAAILVDAQRAPEWMDNLKEARVLRRLDAHSYVEYSHIETPVILKDRDFISQVTVEVEAQGKRFAMRYHPFDLPDQPANGHVRGQILSGLFELTASDDPGKTKLVAEVHCDPMGSIPKWIVNFFQKDWAYDTFQALRKQAKKDDVHFPPAFRDLLTPTLSF